MYTVFWAAIHAKCKLLLNITNALTFSQHQKLIFKTLYFFNMQNSI